MARYAIGLLACAVLLTAPGQAGAGGLVTREQVASSAVVSTAYPGSMTLDGKPAGRVAEYAEPELAAGPTPSPCSGKGCTPNLGHAGTARRLLAAPATREQILRWYLHRLLQQGWHYGGISWTTPSEDYFQLFRPGQTIEVATWSQTDLSSNFPGDQVNHLTSLLASGRKLTVYSVELNACGRCRLPTYSSASPRPAPTIDLSPSCPEPHLPAQVQLSGAARGSTDHTCGDPALGHRYGKSCDIFTMPQFRPDPFLELVIDGRQVYLSSHELRIAGPYTSDGRHLWSAYPYHESPQVIGGSIHLRVDFHPPVDVHDPPLMVDVTAPCTSWFW